MPKRQNTAAQMARLRQAGTGENYTEALRAVQTRSPQRFNMFSARGAGWDPITRRAADRLAQVWPVEHGPHWEEKFGDLCWKTFPWQNAPAGAKTVLREAIAEAAVTCQTCPSPGRKRVVWIWNSEYGWVMPWVKTVCNGCFFVPQNLTTDDEYLLLVEGYEMPTEPEEPAEDPTGCCDVNTSIASGLQARLDQGGVPELLSALGDLRGSIWSRSPHYDAFSGHGVLMAVFEVCRPLMGRVWLAGVASEPLPEPARGQVSRAVRTLEEALHDMVVEEHSD